MFGLVSVRYNSLPINRVSDSGWDMISPTSVDNLRPLGSGNLAAFATVGPASYKMSIIYFLCLRNVPSEDLQISMPRKYLANPKSFIVKES